MTTFLKSDLFLRFLGGFVLGSVGLFMVQPNDDASLTSAAIAAPAVVTAPQDDATL